MAPDFEPFQGEAEQQAGQQGPGPGEWTARNKAGDEVTGKPQPGQDGPAGDRGEGVNQELKTVQTFDHGEGRRRLRLTLGGVGGGLCALAMAAVLVVYGTPFDPVWWWVMGAVLIAAFLGPMAIVPVIEWVIQGYLGADRKL